jgi:hypothetical protein
LSKSFSFSHLDYRRILHQTVSNMFHSIIDSIDKPLTMDISSYKSTGKRNSIDDHNLNPILVENYDRFRKFLQLAIDYIYSFHNECQYFENFTLRLLDICLLGIAYLIEKRSNHVTTRHQMSLLIFRCSDIIKQIGQKLLTIALDPEKQRFFFRIEILKHINDQPNAKAIIEYLLINDTQCYIYHQILIYLQILSKTTPNDSENEQPTNQTSLGQPQKPMDLGHVIISHTHQRVSNGEDSTHTINISMKSNIKKQIKQPVKTDVTQKESSSPDEEARDLGQLSSSSSNNDEQEMPVGKASERSSSSASPSISSLSSEVTPLQQSSIATYPNIINQFRDLLRLVNVPSLTANDNHVVQRRALTEYLLMSSPSTRRS